MYSFLLHLVTSLWKFRPVTSFSNNDIICSRFIFKTKDNHLERFRLSKGVSLQCLVTLMNRLPPTTIKIYIWCNHDDVIIWKHFPRYWPFVRGIHRSPVNSPHKGQWRGALMFFFYFRLNKGLSKQSWGWWFETLSRPLWRHSNEYACNMSSDDKYLYQIYL